MFPSVAGSSSIIALEQNTISDFNRVPASDNAFAAHATYYGAGFASLFANAENEGYNYIQQMAYGISGANHTIWVGDTTSSSKFQFGLRGYINA
jgi:hypothetical protein